MLRSVPAPAASMSLSSSATRVESWARWLIFVAGSVLLCRCIGIPGAFRELDSVVYLRAADDWSRLLSSGQWPGLPLSNSLITTVEYWPPLYPITTALARLLSGMDTLLAAQAISMTCGWLLIFPVFAVGRRLFGTRDGLLACAAVGLYPWLVWLGRVPRTESLFLLLYALGLAGTLRAAWRPSPRDSLYAPLAGASLALACMTRFESTALLISVLLAAALLARAQEGDERRRAWKSIPLVLLGFGLVIAPYWTHLSLLNDGSFTCFSIQKSMYDATEGVTVMLGTRQALVVDRFGPPGIPFDDGSDLRDYYSSFTRPHFASLMWRGLREMPKQALLALGICMPLPLSLAILAFWHGRRDARMRALLVQLLPLPAIIVSTWWDPDPRYYSFMLIPLLLAASRGAMQLWDGGIQLPPQAWPLLRRFIIPMLAFSAWLLPQAFHFALRADVDPSVRLMIANPQLAVITVLAICLATGAVSAGWRMPRSVAVFLAGTVCVVWNLRPPPWPTGQLFAWWPVLSLMLMVLLLAAWYGRWGAGDPPRAVLAATAACMLVIALQNVVSTAVADEGMARLACSDGVAEWLREHPVPTQVIGDDQVDVIRAGMRWRFSPASEREWHEMERSVGLYVVLADGKKPVPLPSLYSARLRRLAIVPADSTDALPRTWEIYEVKVDDKTR